MIEQALIVAFVLTILFFYHSFFRVLFSKIRTRYLRPEISVLEFILILVVAYYIASAI
jgi:hypothetical protein